jgi:C4-dicarboxylate-specific signal transduction histidine kinase
MRAPDGIFERLRKLAVEDPNEARRLFLEVFDANSEELRELLTQLRRPNEGRLRQIVANTIRNHSEKQRVIPELLHWRVNETDEFARRAIEAALADVDIRAAPEPANQDALPSRHLADLYRYVSSRLRHRLRNTMLSAQTQANRLTKLLPTGTSADIQTTIAKLNDAMLRIGRDLEATDVDDEYFRQRSVSLSDWLERLNAQYAATFRPITLQIIKPNAEACRIFGSDYLLETMFWNIWLNAQQAVGDRNCEITIEFLQHGEEVELLINDNGDGFPSDLKDVLFQQVYSTKSPGRGRGMLEIQDAVERLGGDIELYVAREREYRIRVHLPLDLE